MADRYTHGHADAVLRSHRWRTAENSAGYLLDALGPGQRLLDVGCGPGNLSLDLAARVAPGHVVGMDVAGPVLSGAEADRKAAGVADVAFARGDVYDLPFGDGAFDVVHAHQVLQHLADPVAALVEMRRVLPPGGLLAVRDSDYSAFMWSPLDPRLDRWMELHHAATAANGADADAGRHLLGWVRASGFSEATYTTSTWTYATEEDRRWWGDLWADRVVGSAFSEQVLAAGLCGADELEAIGKAFRRWSAHPDAVFVCVHGEVLARA
jgi:ubiquinone/menaquinone biosynthesis C-methylase UbiE